MAPTGHKIDIRNWRTVALSLIGLCAAVPAFAQNRAEIPEGCTPLYTMQKASCEVETLFTCDKGRDVRFISLVYDTEGLNLIEVEDAEYRFLSAAYPQSGMQISNTPISGEESLSGLLETGISEYVEHLEFSSADGTSFTAEGRFTVKLTDRKVVIDGETLFEIDRSSLIRYSVGESTEQNVGVGYYYPRFAVLMSGRNRQTGANGVTVSDTSPITFDFEGDRGFLVTVPLFGCGVISELPRRLQLACADAHCRDGDVR